MVVMNNSDYRIGNNEILTTNVDVNNNYVCSGFGAYKKATRNHQYFANCNTNNADIGEVTVVIGNSSSGKPLW